jgi:hypothetical protein
MKIRLTIFLLILFGFQSGFTQSFSLYYHGIKMTADTVLNRSGTQDTLDLTSFLTIRNNSTTEKRITAKKTEIAMVPGTACSICWAGHCYPPEIMESLFPLLLGPDSSKTSCFAHFTTGGSMGTSKVCWTYFDQDNPSDSVSVLIQYLVYPLGIGHSGNKENVVVSPNPADDNVTFRLADPGLSAVTVQIISAAGKTIFSESLVNPGNWITIPTNTFPSGTYFFELTSGGDHTACGKVIVTH